MSDRGPGPIPNRWLYCPRKSDQVISEKFLAFKTPLSNRFESQMPMECVFPPEMLFGYARTLKLKLGLWIDLTNTKRFYDRDSVESKGAKYIKLQCRGHGETPSMEQTRSFIEIVDDFINERPFDVIGVHCTHGFNRTGFLIVSYMVERLDCSVEAALNAFAQARPPGIYKADYIKELFKRYEDEEDAPPAPELPSWCFEFDDSDNNRSSKRRHEPGPSGQQEDNDDDENAVAAATNGESGEPAKKKKRREMVLKDATFMSGVPGVSLVLDQPRLGELQTKIQEMCEWERSGFPGSQPVSMDRNNLTNLQKKPYRVSWKADGTRYMMLINKRDEIYFFDRNNSCFQVDNISFPRRHNLQEHICDTLLDGEMVIDKVNGQCIPRYLIYDVIKLENDDRGKRPFFPDRLKCIKNELIAPRYEAIRQGIINRPLESFSVRDKEFWELTQAGALLGPKFAKRLSHEPDGLIFQPSLDPYTPGESRDVLKWKPLDMNSVDFRLKISMETGVGIVSKKIGLLFVGKSDVPIASIKYSKTLKDLDNKIIECHFENGQWVFMRERTDKTFPNSYDTAVSVCQSIKNPVTTEILLDYIARYRFVDDNEIMPPPAPLHRGHNSHNYNR